MEQPTTHIGNLNFVGDYVFLIDRHGSNWGVILDAPPLGEFDQQKDMVRCAKALARTFKDGDRVQLVGFPRLLGDFGHQRGILLTVRIDHLP